MTGCPAKSRRPSPWSAALLWLTLLAAYCAPVSAARLAVLPSEDQPVYRQLQASLREALDEAPWEIEVIDPEAPLAEALADTDLLLTLGARAAQRALAQPKRPPTLSVFIPRHTFEVLVESSASASRDLNQGRLSALYLEQPFSRQLNLVSLVKPGYRTLGTLLGPTSIDQQDRLEQAAEAEQVQLLVGLLTAEESPIERLAPVVAHSDAFLAVPDKAAFNHRTARWILLMTLRQRIPLVAYSQRYVQAGAVAAVHSSTETVGRESAALIEIWRRQGILAPPGYPELFEVSVNRNSARSLGLDLPEPGTLAEALRNLEQP